MPDTRVVVSAQLSSLNPGDKLVLRLRAQDTAVLEVLKRLCSSGQLSLTPRVMNIIRDVGTYGTWSSDDQRVMRVEPTCRFDADVFAAQVFGNVESIHISRKKSARTPWITQRLKTVKQQRQRQKRKPKL